MIEGAYYLVASLPALAEGKPAPLTGVEFLARCAPHLSAGDRRRLDEITRVSALAAVRRWRQREESMRVELAVLRARRLGRDEARWAGDPRRDPEAAEVARRIFALPSPVEAEAALHHERWRILDDLEFGHDFDLDRLALYALKLSLLERRAGFDDARGRQAIQDRMDHAHAAACAALGE